MGAVSEQRTKTAHKKDLKFLEICFSLEKLKESRRDLLPAGSLSKYVNNQDGARLKLGAQSSITWVVRTHNTEASACCLLERTLAGNWESNLDTPVGLPRCRLASHVLYQMPAPQDW